MLVKGCDSFASKRNIEFDSLQSQCMFLQKIGAQAYFHAWLVVSILVCVIGQLRLFDHLFNIIDHSSLRDFLCIGSERHLRFRLLGLSTIWNKVQKITLFKILKFGVERVRRIFESHWCVRVCCACCTFRQWAAFHPRLRDIHEEQSLEFIWNKCCMSESIRMTTKECQRILSCIVCGLQIQSLLSRIHKWTLQTSAMCMVNPRPAPLALDKCWVNDCISPLHGSPHTSMPTTQTRHCCCPWWCRAAWQFRARSYRINWHPFRPYRYRRWPYGRRFVRCTVWLYTIPVCLPLQAC